MSNIIGQNDIMPMLPGYAIGNVIKKNTLMLALWTKKISALEEEIRKARIEKIEKEKSEFYLNSESNQKQGITNQLDQKILSLQNLFKEASNSMVKSYDKEDFSIEEMLPIDTTLSKIRIEHRSFASEKLEHLIFRNQDSGNIKKRLEEFSFQLFSQNALSSYISGEAVEGIANKIKNLLLTEQEISLIGSFVTLSRVKIMDPIVIRKTAEISEKLRRESSEYYVLTEAVLGGIFLGFGRSILETRKTAKEVKSIETAKEDPSPLGNKSTKEEDTVKMMSRLSSISFISQGAIPKINLNPHDVNMWSIYVSWKEILEKDPHSGYPIGFKYKKLGDILKEAHDT